MNKNRLEGRPLTNRTTLELVSAGEVIQIAQHFKVDGSGRKQSTKSCQVCFLQLVHYYKTLFMYAIKCK